MTMHSQVAAALDRAAAGRTTRVAVYASMLTLLHPVADRIAELPVAERDSLHAVLELRRDDVDERAARAGLCRLLTWFGAEGPLLDGRDRCDPPVASAGALASLTGAERRVAMAISRGLTNRQAAAELFVSVKTIDSHLQRIYPKLFVRSRRELTALVNGAQAA